jgi:glycosyltransferase involved in cell wall biosynthesis
MLERVEAPMAATTISAMADPARARGADQSIPRGQRVLFLLSTLSIGGSEGKVVKLANALAQEARDITVAYLNRPDPLKEQLSNRVTAINLRRAGKFSFAALRRLRVLIEVQQIDTVIAVNLYATLYAALLKMSTFRRKRIRFFASLNTTDFNTRKARAQLTLYRPLLRSMDRLIFGAEYQLSLWRDKYLLHRCPASSVLYNGVDPEYFSRARVAPYRVAAWPAKRVLIGTVGVLRPEKSHDLLIRAVAELVRRGHDVGVLIVGKGAQESVLRDLCIELDIQDRVHFCGAAHDVRSYLAAMNVFVLTSTAVETFSNAALEALAMECPVVSSAIGGMPEMLSDGGGLTYRSGDLNALIDCLEKLIAQESTRTLLAQQGRAVVLRRFSLESMVAEFRNLLQGDVSC